MEGSWAIYLKCLSTGYLNQCLYLLFLFKTDQILKPVMRGKGKKNQIAKNIKGQLGVLVMT